MQRAANRVSASLAKVIIQCIILQVVVALSLPRLVCNNNFKTKIQLEIQEHLMELKLCDHNIKSTSVYESVLKYCSDSSK